MSGWAADDRQRSRPIALGRPRRNVLSWKRWRSWTEPTIRSGNDPDHGIYPYTTSSSPLAGFASVGAGLPARAIERVVATVKAYSSCVGAGPFTTELSGPCGDELRERGGDAGEYGATTGRPRRVGWFDAVASRYGCAVQGASELAVTLRWTCSATWMRYPSAPPTRWTVPGARSSRRRRCWSGR